MLEKRVLAAGAVLAVVLLQAGAAPAAGAPRHVVMVSVDGMAKANGLTTGAVSWPVSVGIGADFLIPEFAERAQDPSAGIRDVLGPEQARAFGGVEAPLTLNAREGFYFHNATTGEWSIPSTNKGSHGYAPDRPELHATLILSGPGLKTKGDLGIVRMTQIAPTIAEFLGFRLAKEADPPLPLF